MADNRGFPALFDVDARSVEGETTLKLSGELDLCTRPRFVAALADVGQDAARVVIDLSDLTFIDAGSIRLIHRTRVLAEMRGSEFVLRSPNPHLSRILELTGLSANASDHVEAHPMVFASSSMGSDRAVI